jgi:hypothetical protein
VSFYIPKLAPPPSLLSFLYELWTAARLLAKNVKILYCAHCLRSSGRGED